MLDILFQRIDSQGGRLERFESSKVVMCRNPVQVDMLQVDMLQVDYSGELRALHTFGEAGRNGKMSHAICIRPQSKCSANCLK